MSAALPRPIISLVTDRDRLAAAAAAGPDEVEERLLAQVRAAAAAGVDLLQIRELDLDGVGLLRLVERALLAARGTALRVVVNDRCDVARAAGAHGVHLRGDSFSAARLRSLVPPGFLVGRSVHDPDEAAAVVASGGVDYLQFGTVFRSASKPAGRTPAGLEALAAVVRAARPVPVLAIGGVSIASIRDVAATGAAGLAAIGLFLHDDVGGSGSIATTTARLRAAFDSTLDPH